MEDSKTFQQYPLSRRSKAPLSLLLLRSFITITMRRASTLASSIIPRTIAAAHDGGATTVHNRILQAAFFCSSSRISFCNRRRWLSPFLNSFSNGSARAVSLGVTGALASVVVAASFSQAVYAKEPPAGELVPKDVVLYQYEACPFCNKVKGVPFVTTALLLVHLVLIYWLIQCRGFII